MSLAREAQAKRPKMPPEYAAKVAARRSAALLSSSSASSPTDLQVGGGAGANLLDKT
ncbi:unnamed protein product, partial [Amoebophrya sp. A25]|eukprot:GSA25T00014892001.1